MILIIGFLGILIGVYIANKWNQRQETYRMLRYAIDLVIKKRNIYGLGVLESLKESNIYKTKINSLSNL